MNKRPILDDVFVALAAVVVFATATGAYAGGDNPAPAICEDRDISSIPVGTRATATGFDVTAGRRAYNVAIFRLGNYVCGAYLFSSSEDRPRHIHRDALALQVRYTRHWEIGFDVVGGDLHPPRSRTSWEAWPPS